MLSVAFDGREDGTSLSCGVTALSFLCISSVSRVWTEPRQSSCAIFAAGQANEACLGSLHKRPSVFVQGEQAGGSVFECTWSPAPLPAPQCVCLHMSAEGEPRTRFAACQPGACIVLVAGGTYGPVAGHPCVLSRARVHMHTCPLPGFLPLGMLSWSGRSGLHKPVPDCLALCWPFNTLVSRWAQPLLKVTIKWQQLWHLLVPPSAQLKGLVASQRGGPECPPVC